MPAAEPLLTLSVIVDVRVSRWLDIVRECGMRRFGELEAVIMDRLRERGRPALVREILEELRGHRTLAYTTVMTVMDKDRRPGRLLDRLSRSRRMAERRGQAAREAARWSDFRGARGQPLGRDRRRLPGRRW
jgi:hypothetical protein